MNGFTKRLFGSGVRHYWAIGLVASFQIFLFCGYHYERWYKSMLPLNSPRARIGEGLIIRCDGLGYYAWLRSPVIDGDWSFDNEFDDFNITDNAVPGPLQRTELGRRANPWSVGPACVWAITIVPGHLLVSLSQPAGLPWPADGYSLPYQLIVGVTTLLLSIVGLCFLFGICRQFADPARAALAAGLMTLGTTIVYYGSIEVSMAHGVATAAVSVLVYSWASTFGSLSPRRWFLIGVLLGLVALFRWQLITLAVLPAGEAAWNTFARQSRSWREQRKLFGGICVAMLGATLAFSPQMIAWRMVFGNWIASPIRTSPHWMSPAFFQVLFAQDRGFFYWTPLTLIACLGFLVPLVGRGDKSADNGASAVPKLTLLLAAFLFHLYVLASVWGGFVYLGAAYGFRHLTESVVLLAPGLAVLLARMPARAFPWLAALCCLVTLWNLILLCQYRNYYIPSDAGMDPAELLANTMRLIRRKRLLLLGQAVIVPILLWLLVGRTSRK